MSRSNPYRPDSDFHFVFDRGTLGALALGLALVGVLLFTAGILSAGRGEEKPPERLALGPRDLEACRQLVAKADALDPPAPISEPPTALAEVMEEPPAPPPPAPAAPPIAEPTVQVTSGETIFELQLALYHRQGDADDFMAEISSRGYRPYIVPVESSSRKIRYTVRVGTYPDMGSAEKAASELRSTEGLDTVIRYRTLRPGARQSIGEDAALAAGRAGEPSSHSSAVAAS